MLPDLFEDYLKLNRDVQVRATRQENKYGTNVGSKALKLLEPINGIAYLQNIEM